MNGNVTLETRHYIPSGLRVRAIVTILDRNILALQILEVKVIAYNLDEEVVDFAGSPGDGEERAHKHHCLDDAELQLVGLLRLDGAAGSRRAVGGHESRLATDDEQNAPVAEHEDREYDEGEGSETRTIL